MTVFRYILCTPTSWPVTPVVSADAGVCRGPPPLALTPTNRNVKLVELYARICPAVVPLRDSRGRQFPRITLLEEAGGRSFFQKGLGKHCWDLKVPQPHYQSTDWSSLFRTMPSSCSSSNYVTDWKRKVFCFVFIDSQLNGTPPHPYIHLFASFPGAPPRPSCGGPGGSPHPSLCSSGFLRAVPLCGIHATIVCQQSGPFAREKVPAASRSQPAAIASLHAGKAALTAGRPPAFSPPLRSSAALSTLEVFAD